VTLKYRVIERFRGKYSIVAMCKIFEVHRSGYYAWRKKLNKEDKDQRLMSLILECQQRVNYTYGCGRVKYWLKKYKNMQVNQKAIRRIMRKYDLSAQIRRRKPYTHYKEAVHKYNNLLKRQFDQKQTNKFWATDITYIPMPQGMLYMCAVIDLCGKMVISYRIGNDMTASLVTDTIRDALQKEKVTGGLALHSDQGSQYTSQAYFDLTQEYHISPSMSSPGCPYDNAAMENFFGTLKAECLYRASYASRADVEQLVAEYVYFYNYERINLKDGLTPFEIRSKAM
jgi:transposase InsO family protein